MKKGVIVYQGSCQKSISFLESIGMPCPNNCNPADHLLDVISPTQSELNASKVENSRRVIPIDLSLGIDKDGFAERSTRSWLSQYEILCRRNVQQVLRRKDILFVNFFATSLLAVFISMGIWHNIGTSQTSIATRIPSLFFTCVTRKFT